MNFENKTKEELIEELKILYREKRYGLIWEEQQENVDEKMKTHYPVLTNKKENDIFNDKYRPTHILIEGDNLCALELLYTTHKEAIKLIYIDPPYNTGHKDFKFNDDYVDRENSYRHSKWLSFMNRRLRIARHLLKPEGLIFVSIDDNELAQLKLLMDEIFNENNFIAILPTVMNLKGNQDQFGFAGTHEYTLVYAKNKAECKINEFGIDEEELLDEWLEDEYGYYKKGANLKATGVNAPRERRPNLFYPIYIDKDDNIHIERQSEDDIELLPITNGREMSWRWSREKLMREKHDVIVVRSKNGISLYKKQRPEIGDLPSKKPKTLFYKPEYSSGNGTTLLKSMFNGEKVFNNPKPLQLIKDIVKLGSDINDIVLDFFAGSGTTGHAVLEINEEERSNRQFILVTNNENGICTEVCYPRIKKILTGYTDNKGNEIKKITENLKYYYIDEVSKNKNKDQMKVIMASKIYDLLCIKENCFDLIIEEEHYRIYRQGNKIMGVYSFFMEDYINKFKKAIKNIEAEEKIIYSFSYTDYVKEELFDDIDAKVKPIPTRILEMLNELSR